MPRPTSYKTRYAIEVYTLCKLGATDKDIAEFFGVTTTTINTWKEVHPKFLASLKAGKIEADKLVLNSLFKRAQGYQTTEVKKTTDEYGKVRIVETTKFVPPDTTAGIFWLKNRDPDAWRDTSTGYAQQQNQQLLALEKTRQKNEKLIAELKKENTESYDYIEGLDKTIGLDILDQISLSMAQIRLMNPAALLSLDQDKFKASVNLTTPEGAPATPKHHVPEIKAGPAAPSQPEVNQEAERPVVFTF